MRIDKSAAIGALGSEIARLTTQATACDVQFAKLVSIATPGLEGEAAREFRANVRRYAIVLLCHKCFYQSVANADRRNIALIATLPTTNGLVLDTDVAQSRIDAAEAEIARLRAQRDAAVARAQRINDAIAYASSFVAPGFHLVAQPVDINAIRIYYDMLIAAQYVVIEYNRMVLALANRYDVQSSSIYSSVDHNVLKRSTEWMTTLITRGVWGPVGWGIDFLIGQYGKGFSGDIKTHGRDGRTAWRKFLDGDLEAKNALFGANSAVNGFISGIPVSVKAEAEAIGGKASLVPDAKWKIEKGEAYAGVKGKAEGFLGRVELENTIGNMHGEDKISVGNVSAEGALGISLMKYGKLSPSLRAQGKAEATGASVETSARIGSEDSNIHGKGDLKAGTASAEGKVNIGVDGIELGGKAEAYAAKGSVSGGLTIFGVKIDVELEAGAGGASAKAGAAITEDKVSGEIGAGLGLGAGIKVTIDFGGLFGHDADNRPDYLRSSETSGGGGGGSSGGGGGGGGGGGR